MGSKGVGWKQVHKAQVLPTDLSLISVFCGETSRFFFWRLPRFRLSSRRFR
jgi:hypothetical protein